MDALYLILIFYELSRKYAANLVNNLPKAEITFSVNEDDGGLDATVNTD